jgi:hypothetical protein
MEEISFKGVKKNHLSAMGILPPPSATGEVEPKLINHEVQPPELREPSVIPHCDPDL